MNNKRLAEIIKDPGTATDKEVKQIKTYSEEYSYSAFLKVLQARLDHLHDKKDKSKSLTKAAIYIADRSILKDFITKDEFSKAPSEDIPAQEKAKKEKKEDKSVIDSDKKDRPGDREKEKKQEPVVVDDKLKDKVEEEAPDVLSEEVVAEPASKAADQDVATDQDVAADQDLASVTDKVELQDAESLTDEKEILDPQVESGIVESTDTDVESRKKQKEHSSEEPKEKPEPIIEEQEQEHKSTDEEQEQVLESSINDQVSEQEAELDRGKEQDTPTEDPEQKHKTKSSLSKEIMDNISELKKHKASLLNLLNIGSQDKSSAGDSKKEKSSKKDKNKQKEAKKDKKKDTGKQTIESEKIDPKVSQPVVVPESKNYPDYEEEDPVVIKDFLTRLEESNPPPKKKLKKEEQEKLIEKFIQSDPQMQNVRSSKELAEKKDLSAHSVKFRDDIISENLASIMIKQGKHEKAIDIYKKLIWKFPQKKAYFATQIEDLKKKLKK